MPEYSDFDSVVKEKVATIKLHIIAELDKTPESKVVKVPFYVPIRQDRLFPDFRQTVKDELLKEGYEMSDFLEQIEVLGYGVTRYVNITIL